MEVYKKGDNVDLVYVKVNKWDPAEESDISEFLDITEGEVYKGFKLQTGAIIVDTNDDMAAHGGMYVEDESLDRPDLSFDISIIDVEDILDFKLTDSQVQKIIDWESDKENILEGFKNPLGTKQSLELDFDDLMEMSQEEEEDTVIDDLRNQAVNLALDYLKENEKEIYNGLGHFIMSMMVGSQISSKNNDPVTDSMVKSMYKILEDQKLGKGGNVFAINQALLNYHNDSKKQNLHKIIIHALLELNRNSI